MFKRANKSAAKLRAAIFGPSGSGKTYSALRIATGMGGSIAVIDSEHGSASKYSDRFEFDACDLGDKSITGYCEAINAAAAAGYGVLIIDSLSHAWQELLTQIDQLAKTKYRGNTWSAWSEGTPHQRALVESLLSFPGHVLGTMRSKTAWEIQKSDNGKTKPVRLGMEPEQGKGIEYEFDLLLELSADHYCTIIKDRTGKFQDKIIEKPGEVFGAQLTAWLSEGSAPTPPAASPPKAKGWTLMDREERIAYSLQKLDSARGKEQITAIRDKIALLEMVEEDRVHLLSHCETLLHPNGNIGGIVTAGHSKTGV